MTSEEAQSALPHGSARAHRDPEVRDAAIGNTPRILDSMRDGACLVAPGHVIAFTNAALERILGSEAVGQACHLRLAGHPVPCDGCRWPDGPVACPRDLEKDGRIFEVTCTQLTLADGSCRLLATFRDVTAERLLAQTLREAALAARAKDDFLANMSHELLTPLNAIIGFSEIMRLELFGGLGSETYLGYANDIHRAGKHLLQLVNDVLDIASIEAGKATLFEEEFGLGPVIATTLGLIRERAAEAAVAITHDVQPTLPSLRADPRRVKQVLLNLLSNAVKFTPPGGGIHICAAAPGDGTIECSVSDTGIGMGAEDVEHALRPFEQLDAGMARRFQGSGLGLPLAKHLMEMHCGRLEIVTAPGAGTKVKLTFPVHRVLRRCG